MHRRIHEFGLTGALHSNLSDRDLDNIVTGFVQAHPRSGQWLLVGHLRSLDLRIPRARARNSLLRVDPHMVLPHGFVDETGADRKDSLKRFGYSL